MEIIVLDNPNAEKKMEKEVQKKTDKLISDISPEKYLVYFPLAIILNNLDVEQHFGFLQSNRNFQFNVFDIFSSLVFARAVALCSKYKTFHDVLPSLFKEMNYSYDQLLDAVEFVDSEYEKLVEIFTVATKENYGTDTSHSFFDCTNFFFEIDKENDFQRRGPSKENKNDSIVGMGLLLDANIIPIGKKMYPGNESEKPILRNIIQDMKNQNNISGKTIQIADKGLNCARNIIQAVNNSDGYIFSKSVKQLSEKEKVWVLLNNDYKDVKDEYGNTVYRYKACIEDFDYSYKDDDGKIVKKTIREKRVCTYNPKLARKKLMEIDKMVEKARNLKTYSAKKSEYGESGKYITITSNDGDHPIVTLNEEAIKYVISPEKDVDCFSPINSAKIMEGDKSGFPPCTPTAVVEILKHYNVPLNGANVVVLGRSMVVGKPAAMLLLAENATVTICHSRTKDLPKVCAEADVLVASVGRARMVKADYVKEGAVVIDVGINAKPEGGGICGDVDTDDVVGKASMVTPVPAGVGSVTTSILAKHVIKACKQQNNK